MEASQRIEEDPMQQIKREGKDEMNLAEFPLCALAHRLRPEQKTLRFEDRICDKKQGETITRQLTITGSDAYGLPTALDDEVLLGLIQLSRLHDFADRKVPFTRHQLIQILGWRDDSKTYARLEASLNRWTGVTLYYQKAWWNKARQCWMDEKFHVLDNVWLCHRFNPPPDTGLAGGNASVSAFVWNEILFRSFGAGNLKSIDFEFFKALRSAVAKRLYRFLDKRFFHRNRCEFNLHELAWEHLGLARSYDTANLKRKLQPAINELEQRHYLVPMPRTERFRKVHTGDWRVTFEKADGALPIDTPDQASSTADEPFLRALTERGVSPSVARETVAQFPADRVKSQIAVFDWLRARSDTRVSRNPPGYLIAAIRGGYSLPLDYVNHQHNSKNAEMAAELTRRAEDRQRAKADLREAQERQREKALAEFWQALPEAEKHHMELVAMQQASGGQHSMAKLPGKLGEAARKVILDAYLQKLLDACQTQSGNNQVRLDSGDIPINDLEP